MGKFSEDLRVYFREIAVYPRLTQAEESHLLHLTRRGDQLARDHLIRSNLRLVVQFCTARHKRTSATSGLCLAELIAEGNLALIRAVDTYDSDKGRRFSTHATYLIRQHLRDLHCTQGLHRLPIPHDSLTQVLKFQKTQEYLAKRDGRPPSFDQVADALDLSPDRRREMRLKLNAKMVVPESECDGRDSNAIAVDPGLGPAELVLLDDLLSRLKAWLDRLDPEDSLVLKRRFGIDSEREYRRAEIAAELGVSITTIRTIEFLACQRLGIVLRES